MSALCEGQRQPLPWDEVGQHLRWNIGGNIAVVVQMNDRTDDCLTQALWSGVREPHQFCEVRTKLGWLYPACQVGCNGTGEVTAMKRRGYLRQKIGSLRQHIGSLEPFTLYDPCEQPVIRTHVKFPCLCDKQHRMSRCPDSRINHSHKDGTRRKVMRRGVEQIRCGVHIKGTHLVGEVHELRRGMDAQNGALELRHIGIACTKIGEQRNNHDTPHVPLQARPTVRAPRLSCRSSAPQYVASRGH